MQDEVLEENARKRNICRVMEERTEISIDKQYCKRYTSDAKSAVQYTNCKRVPIKRASKITQKNIPSCREF